MLKEISYSILFLLFAGNLISQNAIGNNIILEDGYERVVNIGLTARIPNNELLPIINDKKEVIKNINTTIDPPKINDVRQNPQQIIDLELIPNNPIKQLETTYDKRFDLSGITLFNDRVYVIADKEWDNHIYRLDTGATSFKVTSVRELCIDYATDFEGIDRCDGKFYLIDESRNNVYMGEMISCDLVQIPVAWEKLNIDRSTWGNKGLEGLAYDCEKKLLYLGKEREPRRIFLINLTNNEISEPFADIINSDEVGYDIGDMKYENGNLYILERGRGLVTRIDTKTKQFFSVSYQQIVLKNKQRLYNNSSYKFGMAEALMLTEDQIWIGLDNNGDEVSDYGKSIGLKPGNKPVIFIFKRPQGF